LTARHEWRIAAQRDLIGLLLFEEAHYPRHLGFKKLMHCFYNRRLETMV